LLDLIKKNDIDINTLKVAEITDKYIEYINTLEKLDMDETSSFLTLASRLLELKSLSLLPKEEQVDEDGEQIDPDELARRFIKEYKLFKEAGQSLAEIENVNRLYKQPDKSAGDTKIVFNDFNLEKLLDAFAIILMRTKDKEEPPEKKIKRDRWTVPEKISFINSVLTEQKETSFFSLFDDTYTKMEIITVFLAILELLKTHKIEVVQAERYEDIKIKKSEDANEN
ncbi:MAG: segregation/condensation protein A, partial [Clostridia bacterium]|nr:segregation/condensation protein A [Clostridia bacterium]